MTLPQVTSSVSSHCSLSEASQVSYSLTPYSMYPFMTPTTSLVTSTMSSHLEQSMASSSSRPCTSIYSSDPIATNASSVDSSSYSSSVLTASSTLCISRTERHAPSYTRLLRHLLTPQHVLQPHARDRTPLPHRIPTTHHRLSSALHSYSMPLRVLQPTIPTPMILIRLLSFHPTPQDVDSLIRYSVLLHRVSRPMS